MPLTKRDQMMIVAGGLIEYLQHEEFIVEDVSVDDILYCVSKALETMQNNDESCWVQILTDQFLSELGVKEGEKNGKSCA